MQACFRLKIDKWGDHGWLCNGSIDYLSLINKWKLYTAILSPQVNTENIYFPLEEEKCCSTSWESSLELVMRIMMSLGDFGQMWWGVGNSLNIIDHKPSWINVLTYHRWESQSRLCWKECCQGTLEERTGEDCLDEVQEETGDPAVLLWSRGTEVAMTGVGEVTQCLTSSLESGAIKSTCISLQKNGRGCVSFVTDQAS